MSTVFFGKRVSTARSLWMALRGTKGLGPTLALQASQTPLPCAPPDAPLPPPTRTRWPSPPPPTPPRRQVCETLGHSREQTVGALTAGELRRVQRHVESSYFVERELDKAVAADRARLASLGAWRGRGKARKGGGGSSVKVK